VYPSQLSPRERPGLSNGLAWARRAGPGAFAGALTVRTREGNHLLDRRLWGAIVFGTNDRATGLVVQADGTLMLAGSSSPGRELAGFPTGVKDGLTRAVSHMKWFTSVEKSRGYTPRARAWDRP
jgi:hypothetical protein